MFCIIYKITNKINKKTYIGQTWQTMKLRFLQHSYSNDSIKLYNAIKKYGLHNFTIECITIANTQEIANILEIQFIAKYQSNIRHIGYNISNGGNGVGKHSLQTKVKLSKSLKGKKKAPFTKIHKTNMSKAKMGHSVSQEARDKISKANIGRKLTKEQANNIGFGHLGLKYNMKDRETRNKNISLGKKKKISDNQVIEIITKWKTKKYTAKQLAKEYNTTDKYIYGIISGKKRKLALK